MHRLFLLVMALVWGGAAMAADKPAFGPTPVWVQALELPTPDETIGGPAQMLLQDVQVRLRPEGTEHYSRTAFRVNTPQGLGALGSIGFVWSPEIDVVTFHHVRAVRGAEVIDLMGDGSGFQVLRREENLEWAMLDGRLTAVIQPVGLEVGDIIDFAYTLHRRDPITRGLGEVATGNLLAAPAGRSHIRVLWNKAQPTRYRLAEGMPKVKATTRGDQSELVVDLQDAPAYKYRSARLAALKKWATSRSASSPAGAKSPR